MVYSRHVGFYLSRVTTLFPYGESCREEQGRLLFRSMGLALGLAFDMAGGKPCPPGRGLLLFLKHRAPAGA